MSVIIFTRQLEYKGQLMGMGGDMLKRRQEEADRLGRFYVTHTMCIFLHSIV
jgi:hypothetical protein